MSVPATKMLMSAFCVVLAGLLQLYSPVSVYWTNFKGVRIMLVVLSSTGENQIMLLPSSMSFTASPSSHWLQYHKTVTTFLHGIAPTYVWATNALPPKFVSLVCLYCSPLCVMHQTGKISQTLLFLLSPHCLEFFSLFSASCLLLKFSNPA